MFRDVTFGQYYLTDSFVHKMDARIKLLLTLLFMVGIFFVQSFAGFALITVLLAMEIICSRVPFRSVVRPMKGIIILLVLTAILNVLFVKSSTEPPLWSWWKIEIYTDGLIFAAKMWLRLVYLVVGTSLLTLTTTPVDLNHALESLMQPLRIVRFPVHEFALLISLTLSLIPGLIEETDRIIRAQKARGANFDTGNLIKRARAFVPILIPLFVGGFRRADELANAMNSRCYEGAKKRTKMHVMKLSWRDFVGMFFVVVIFTAIFVLYGMKGQWTALQGTWGEVMKWLYF